MNGGFSLGGFFDAFAPSTIVLGLLFIIFFALLNWALNRTLNRDGQHGGTAGIIAFCASALAIYGIHLTGFDMDFILDFLYGLGIDTGILVPILMGFLAIISLIILWQWKISGFLLAVGGFFILLSFFAYERGLALTIGIILVVFGLWMLFRKFKKKDYTYDPSGLGVMRGAQPRRRLFGRKKKFKNLRKTGKGFWKGAKGVGKGAGWVGKQTGKYGWKGVKGVGRGGKLMGKKVGRGTQNIYQSAKDKRQQKIALKQENIERQQRLGKVADRAIQRKAQQQQTKFNAEISRLQKMIPNAQVIERGKIEAKIRNLQKQQKKLGKR